MVVDSVPYDLYLRFLYTKGLVEFAAVKNEMIRLGLATPTYDSYYAQCTYVNKNVSQETVRLIERKRYDRDFLKWMVEVEVGDLWYGEEVFKNEDTVKNKDVHLMMDIHNDPIFRLNLNALLIKNVNLGDLVPMLNIKFSTTYKLTHFLLYRKYFFNPQRMLRGDWKEYLRNCTDVEKSIYFCALTEPLETLKSKLGLPARVEVSEELARLLRQSIDKANQYLSIGSKETNHEARAWIDTTLKLTEKYEKYRTADSSDFGKALQMEFEYVDTEFETPDSETLEKLNQAAKDKEAKRLKEEESLFDEDV
jgi:hypothetical protein